MKKQPCRTNHAFWPLKAGLLPATAIVMNLGLYGPDITLTGAGLPLASMGVPSAGVNNPNPPNGTLFHPAATALSIQRLPIVKGGAWKALIVLIYP